MKKIFLTLSLVFTLFLLACNTTTQMVELDNGLIIEDVKVGNGAEIVSGDTVKAHYTGKLEDGTVFDSSRDREEAAIFPIGIGFLIEGWEQGLIGMKEGGERNLTIPSDLGYGDVGAPENGIPGGATLFFEIELLEIL